MKQRHTQLRDRVIRRLNGRPEWFAWKVNNLQGHAPGGYAKSGPPGQPDIYAIRKVHCPGERGGKTVAVALGLLVGIEIKVGDDKQRATQVQWQRIMESRGAVYRILRFAKRGKVK